MRINITLLFLVTSYFLSAQNFVNSDTRKFIENASITLVTRDWNTVANLKSGTGETVSFFPIEISDLKTGHTIKALQVDMSVDCRGFKFSKSSWIDLDEASEFLYFIENFVIPKLSMKTESKKSNTYIFKSKEITVSFTVSDFTNKLSVHLNDEDCFNQQCYFWTETQTGTARKLSTVLQSLK